jgi:hypothetical protein
VAPKHPSQEIGACDIYDSNKSTGLVLVECAVLAVNKGRCPLTDWAARYTVDRSANFDIFIPEWLARHNKVVFGTLFLCGEAVVLWELFW